MRAIKTLPKKPGRPLRRILSSLTVIFGAIGLLISLHSLQAAPLTYRSVSISTPIPGATATHTFEFTITSASNVGSIEFEYCTNDPFIGTPCVVPDGLDTQLLAINAQSGETGFSLHANSTANRIVLTRPVSETIPGVSRFEFSNITNPSSPLASVYVRIATFSSTDGTGQRTDAGAVVFSTNGSLSVSAFVPPYLRFCTGLSVDGLCANVVGAYINLGTLSPRETRFATSQMAAATNDDTGYVVSAHGTTMTSGNNTIAAPATVQASQTGTAQFGLNLRNNAVPDIGQNPSGSGSGTVAASYNLPDQFRFQSGDAIASSDLPTEPNIFTVSYIVNVPPGQAPGTYTTTLTYIAVAQF